MSVKKLICVVFGILCAAQAGSSACTASTTQLSCLITAGDVDSAQSMAKVNSTLFAGLDSYAGYMTVNEITRSILYFWYFPKDNGVEEKPLLFWFEGGPGTSSMHGLFTEAGPLEIVNGSAVVREIGNWGLNYSLVFVDNPVGTGFSSTASEDGYAHDEDDVGTALLNFTQQFLTLFPDQKTAPLFLVGSSYAGKFIPALGYYIHQYNNATSDESDQINLKGLVLGDPWVDPPSYTGRAQWALSLGLIDEEQGEAITRHEDAAITYYEAGDYVSYSNESDNAYNLFLSYSGVNQLNWMKDTADGLGVSTEYISFLNRADVQAALLVNMTFSLFNETVTAKMAPENWLTLLPRLEYLLEYYNVLCYNGQMDTMIPYPMSMKSYNRMSWSGAEEYRNANRTQLIMDGRIIGYQRQASRFTEIMVRDAGHLVTQDQPAAAKYILDQFIRKYK